MTGPRRRRTWRGVGPRRSVHCRAAPIRAWSSPHWPKPAPGISRPAFVLVSPGDSPLVSFSTSASPVSDVPLTTPSLAVFLSYPRENTAAVQRMAEALRGAGIEVWFDQSELVGADAWDAKLRGHIASCALFVPVISTATQARREGYFRLEWRLAAQRSHMMSERTAFLLPVVIDATRDAEADVPTEFKAVQWTRLASGEATPQFVERIKRLLALPPGAEVASPAVPASNAPGRQPVAPRRRAPVWIYAAAAVAVLATCAFFALRKPAVERQIDRGAAIRESRGRQGRRVPRRRHDGGVAQRFRETPEIESRGVNLVVLFQGQESPDRRGGQATRRRLRA